MQTLKVIKASLMIIFVLSILVACSDIFEKNIEDKTVYIVSPPDGLHSTKAAQTFWWDYVEGATDYNLQIVKPSFEYIETLLLDTNITINKFTITLDPGEYQWRVSAYNSGYATPFTTYNLTIDTTAGQSVKNNRFLLKIQEPVYK